MDKERIRQLPRELKEMWKTPPKGRYMNLKEVLCLGGGAMGVSFIVNVIQILLTASTIPMVYGFDVIHGPLICLTASLLGLLFQPLYGKMLQNCKTKLGRYKPFLIFIAPVISVFAVLATWQPQNLTENQRIIFAYCTCIPSLFLWNLWFNTLNMMPAVVTPNQQERTDIWSPISLLIGFAPTVMNFIKGFISSHFIQEGHEYLAYRWMGIISCVVGLALVLLIFKVKERIIETAENNEKVGVFEGLGMVFKNGPLMIFTLALVVGSVRLTIDLDAELIGRLRYATTTDKAMEIFSSLTLITGFAVTPNMILLPLLTRKFNNRTIMMFWSILNSIGYMILAIIGIENIPQGSVSAAVITTMRFVSLFNAIISLQPLMLSELYDYQQLKTGKRLEGFIQAFGYALVLVFTNVGYLIMSVVKRAMGFDLQEYFNKPVIPDDLMNIATRYFDIALWVSAVSALLMGLIMIFYKLDKKKHREIVEELKRRSEEEGYEALKAQEVSLADIVSGNADDHATPAVETAGTGWLPEERENAEKEGSAKVKSQPDSTQTTDDIDESFLINPNDGFDFENHEDDK